MTIPSINTLVASQRPGTHSTDLSNNIILAYYHLSNMLGATIAGSGTLGTSFVVTNENEGLAVAYLAINLIDNMTAESKLKVSELVDEEIRHLLFNEGDDLDSSVWVTSNTQPQLDYEVTRYT